MRLTQRQIAALWIVEGGNPATADLASSVSMAESGGDSGAGNSCCHGIYQFNVEVGVTSMTCALDPICATKKAISMSHNGTNWSAWEAYTNGAYRQFVGKSGFTKNADSRFASFDPGKVAEEAGKIISPLYRLFKGEAPLPSVPGQKQLEGAVTGGIGSVFNISGLGDIAKVLEGVGELFLTREGWVRLAKLIGGAIMLLWGLRIVIRESTGADPVSTVTQTAGKAAAVAATVK